MIFINKRECLNVGKVLTFRIHNVGTVPKFEMHNVGTAVFYDTFEDQTFWTYFIWLWELIEKGAEIDI